jgi:epoxyqueuosine reductase
MRKKMTNGNRDLYTGTLEANGTQFSYQYRTLPIDRLSDLQEDIEKLRCAGQISDAEIFQSYVSQMSFSLPENFPGARSILILALSVPPRLFHCQYNGQRIPATMPSNYYEPGLTGKMLTETVQQKIIGAPGYQLKQVYTYHLKLLAVRSGLGCYGRNNICYVDGMGSFLTLHAYLTDYRFETDGWQAIRALELCQDCSICLEHCPMGAIRADNFVIDIKRCLPLYNEVQGNFPDWFPAGVHHTFMGCMKCQYPCPANRAALKQLGQLEDLTEDETRQFASGSPDEATILSVSQKLKVPYMVGSPETVEVACRNLKALLPV